MSINSQSAILHMSNLPFDTTEEDLRDFFRSYQVSFLSLISKAAKKYARIEFATPGIAEKVLNELNGVNFLPKSTKTGLMKVISLSKFEEKDQFSFKNDVSKNVLVKNVPLNFTGREFFLMMKKYGEIKYMKYKIDFLGRSKGYGQVYYYDEPSALKAIEDLNGKKLMDKELIVCHLIPGKTAGNYKNNLYIKNFPKNFSENDLKQYFNKYGEVKSVLIARDENGVSKGFGFVCFDNPKNAHEAFMKENASKTKFEGCEGTLYINYAMKKEDRVEMILKNNSQIQATTIFAKLREDLLYITTKEEIEKEIRQTMKLIIDKELVIKEIKVRSDNKTALITFLNSKQLEEFMNAYINYSTYYLPRIFFNYFQNKDTKVGSYLNQINDIVNPLNMFSHFSSLSVIDPTDKPVISLDQTTIPNKDDNVQKEKKFKVNSGYYKANMYNKPKPHHKKNYYGYGYGYNSYKKNNYYEKRRHPRKELVEIDDTVFQKAKTKSLKEVNLYNEEEKEEICNEIYEYVYSKYPNEAGKITGMIIDLGYEEIKRLNNKKEQLDSIIEEAMNILNKTNN